MLLYIINVHNYLLEYCLDGSVSGIMVTIIVFF